MYYREYQPRPPLDEFVRCYWILEDSAGSSVSPVERIVPDGCMELIVHYGDPFHSGAPQAGPAHLPRSVLAGQITCSLELHPSRRVGMIAARFHPFGARGVLGDSMVALANQIVPGAAIWGRAAADLEERMVLARSDAERVDLLEAFLLRQRRRPHRQDDLVRGAVRCIAQEGGNVNIEALAGQVNLSIRQLERRFQDAVGLSPKLLSRIVRFRRVFEAYERGDGMNWAAVAVDCGYFDQAHLTRDFRQFAGEPPATYLDGEGWISRCLTRGAMPVSRVGFLQDASAGR